jgi:hypothetical protein
MATTTLEAKCFCAATHFTITVPTALLPLPTHLCHCSFCRWYTGTLAVFHARLPAAASPDDSDPTAAATSSVAPVFVAPSSRAATAAYVHGPAAEIEALFCRKCGCHVATHTLPSAPGPERWTVATSIFSLAAIRGDGEEVVSSTGLSALFQITKHIFPASARDGGLAALIPAVGDRTLQLWDPPPSDPRAGIIPTFLLRDRDGAERVQVQCHCGRASYSLGRPSARHRAHAALAQACISQDGQGNRWKAQLDVCRDCRLQTGAHVQPWATVPASALWPPLDSDVGTLRAFSSSANVTRFFCGNCGASVFVRRKRRRRGSRRGDEGGEDEVVSLAVGVLRAPEGPLAENWLEWTDEVAYEASGRRFDHEFVEALVVGLRGHRIGQHRQI